MAKKKRIGIFLIVAGVSLFALAGFRWRGDPQHRAALGAQRTMLEDSARSVHDRLIKTSLQSRGFQNSFSSMPDSVRRYGGKKLMEVSGGYNKTIRKLEFQERDLKVDIARTLRESDRERASARAQSIPLAVTAFAALLTGTVLVLVPARPDAA